MSKGFKKILPFAALLIPFAGPYIATAASGFLAKGVLAGTIAKGGLLAKAGGFLATKAGAAAVGAGLGAVSGGITGGAKGALLGAVGGGIGSYARAGQLAANAAKGVAGAAGGAITGPGGAFPTIAQANAAAGGAAAPATLGSRIMGAISSVGGNIAQGLQNPDMWGRAAQYLGAAALGKATAKPDPALQAYIKELQRVSADNRTIQQAAFGVGNELVSEARGINPIAEGQIEANEAQLRVLGAGQQAVRNMPASKEAMRAVGTQQYYTDAARAGASAFNIGFRGGRADRRAGLQGAYSGVPLRDAQGAGAAQLSMQQAENEGNRQAGLLASLKYITTGQQPAGQQTQGQQPAGSVGTPPSMPGRPVLPDPNNPVYETMGA